MGSDSETNADKTFDKTPGKAKTPPAKAAKKVKTAKSATAKSAAAPVKDGQSHPKYSDMIIEAIKELKLRTGCSRTAILKQIKEVHDLGDEKRALMYLTVALKKGVEKGSFKMAKEEGKNSKKYKLGENAEVKKKKKGGEKKKKKKKKKKKS